MEHAKKVVVVFLVFLVFTSQSPVPEANNTGNRDFCYLKNGQILAIGEHRNSTVTGGCRLITCSHLGDARATECPAQSCSRIAVADTLIGSEYLYPDCCSRIPCRDNDYFFTDDKSNRID